jgi:hypothetical protein
MVNLLSMAYKLEDAVRRNLLESKAKTKDLDKEQPKDERGSEAVVSTPPIKVTIPKKGLK